MTSVCTSCGSHVKPDQAGGVCLHCLFTSLTDEPSEEKPHARASIWSLPGYEVSAELARGSTGIVYKARQLQPKREVAIKVLLPTWGDTESFRERFTLEVQTLASLDHPGILPVYEFGEHDGLPWFSMRLAQGGSLASRIPDYKSAWREIAALMADVAEGIAHAHGRGVLHRDLKPGNLLFAEDGRVFIGDFGLARILSTPSDVTVTAAVLGTPAYLPPEVIEKGASQATTSSDIWGLGAVLYELLGQRKPFEGATIPDLIAKIVSGEPAPLRDVPRDLSAIAFHALRKDPQKRYASALAFAADLRAWLSGDAVIARPYSQVERTRLYARRHPVVATLIATGVLAAFASVGVGIREVRLRQAEAAARARAETAETAALERLRSSSMAEATARLLTTGMGHRNQALSAAKRAAEIRPGTDATSAGLAALLLYDLKQVAQGRTNEHQDEKAFFSPDRARAFRIPLDETFIEIISNWATSSPTSLRAETEADTSTTGWLYFSASGRYCGMHFANDVIRIWDSTTGRTVVRLENRPFPAPSGLSSFGQDIAFSPDDRSVAVGNAEGGLDLLELENGRLLASWKTNLKVHFSSFSPDGKWLAAGCGRVRNGDGLFLLDGKTLTLASQHHVSESEPVRGLAWSRDSQNLLQASERSLHVRKGDTGEVLYSIGGDIAEIPWSLGYFSNDELVGGQVAVSGRFNLVSARNGKTLLNGEFPSMQVKSPLSFSANGMEIVSRISDTQAAVFQIEKPLGMLACKPRFSWESASSLGSALSFSPDGRALAVFGLSTISLWDTETGASLSWIDLGTANDHTSGVFAEGGKALWLSRMSHGVYRIPVSIDADTRPRLGDLFPILEQQNVVISSVSRKGDVIGIFVDETERAQSTWRLLDPTSKTFAHEQALPFAGGTVLSPDGEQAAVMAINNEQDTQRNAVTVVDVRTGRRLAAIPGGSTELINALWISKDRLCVFGSDAADGVWDLKSQTRIAAFPDGASSRFSSLTLDPTGQLLAAATGQALTILDAASLKALVAFPTGNYGEIAQVAFAPNARKVAAVNYSNEVYLWDLDALHEALTRNGLGW